METLLVGYGTLLLRASLGQSIGGDAARGKQGLPVIVHGYRRLFNLRPEHYATSNRLGTADIENGALNVERATGAAFNGIAMPMSADELERLDTRERYYRRVRARLVAFDTGVAIGEGFLYAADAASPWVIADPARLMPLWRDVVWARTGAYAISDAFGRFFDATTYLADGETLVVDHYHEHLLDTSDVEIPV